MTGTGLMRLLARLLVVAACALGSAGALAWAAGHRAFALHRIQVEGDLRHVGRSAIRAAIAGHLNGTFFTVPLAEARGAFETIPWVAAASVRRVWPDRLVVHLEERRAIGVWDDGRVLSDAGTLFPGNPAEAELDGPLVEFSGPARHARDVAAALPALRSALAALPATLAAVNVSERASWTLRTGTGQIIELGRDDPPGAVLQRLATVVASFPAVVATLDGVPARVDARYNNGFAAAKP